MGKRKMYAILDIETLTDARLALDIAWILYDSKGNEITRHNYLVKEVVETPFFYHLLRNDRFMRDKAQYYCDALSFNSIEVVSLEEIAMAFNTMSYNYNCDIIMCAYNAAFDFETLNTNSLVYYGYNFFDDNITVLDIMVAAMSTICNTNKYVRWCNLLGFLTPKGNVKTSAEVVYRYISANPNFIEAHHALLDCEIESKIFFKAKAYKKKQKTHFANPVFSCPEWQAIQARQ